MLQHCEVENYTGQLALCIMIFLQHESSYTSNNGLGKMIPYSLQYILIGHTHTHIVILI